jgi:hypothetical protein
VKVGERPVVGELYKVKHAWHLSLPFSERDHWKNRLGMYVGESIINRDDGVKITNLVFLLNGEMRLADQSFLRCIVVVNETR